MSINRGMSSETMIHYTMEYYSAVQKMRFTGEWMELETNLNEVNPDPKRLIVLVLSYTWVLTFQLLIHVFHLEYLQRLDKDGNKGWAI